MGDANEGRRRAMENLSLEIDKYPRDLLQRFMCSGESQPSEFAESIDGEDELELNLGLSLGGRFGVDKSSKSNKLIRSSSIATTMPIVRDDNDATAPSYTVGLMRTSSLPTETEEEWRKRKDLQTLRRLEAKRRRSEKQRSSNSGKGEEERRELEGPIGPNVRDKRQQSIGPTVGLPSWVTAATKRQAAFGGGVEAMAKLKAEILGGFQGFGGKRQQQMTSQSSMESSQGGGSSSGMSELESKPLQGSSSFGETRSPASNQMLQEQSNHDAVGSSGTGAAEDASRTSRPDRENPSKKPNSSGHSGERDTSRNSRKNALEDMPCVFTKGDGPNGRKVEGILYRYGKGEEVRIMCVCHGSFLSPAEFVKHAGGSDVTHPLRHIVVNPAATSFL